MKMGRSLSELAAELDRQAQSKRDFIAPSTALSLVATSDGNHPVVLEGVNGGMPLRPVAHQQLATTLGIPKPYYDRMLAEAPDLLAANANRWIKTTGKRLIRTLDGEVRAILSDSYRPLDNLDLAEAVLPKLLELDAAVISGEVTENRFYLKAVSARVEGLVKVGDLVQAGLVVSNSEVGQGSLRVEALDYRLVCTNGMIRDTAVRRAHLGRGSKHDAIEDAREYFRDETRQIEDRAFFLKVQDATAAMFDKDRFDLRLNQYREASEQVIKADPVQVVEVTAKKLGFSESEKSSVLQHLIRGGDLSKWGLANAITRTAEDLGDYDRSTEFEAIGGKVVEMPQAEWKSLAV